jgi:hypothetical protein
VVRCTLSNPSIGDAASEVKLLWEIISAFSPTMKPILHSWENGPDGIRTRICDLDRVPCCHYTTGPSEVSATATMVTRLSITTTARPMPNQECCLHSQLLVIPTPRILRCAKDPDAGSMHFSECVGQVGDAVWGGHSCPPPLICLGAGSLATTEGGPFQRRAF